MSRITAPKSIIVGAYIIQVIFTHLDHKGESSHDDELIIRLSEKIEGMLLAETFLHEVIHALWYLYKVGGDPNELDAYEFGEMSEEEVVARLSFAITNFISQNKQAMKWYESLLESESSKSM